MKNALRHATVAIALLASVGVASGQAGPPGPSSSQMKLTPAQRVAILAAVLQDGGRTAAPTGFQPSVGGPVPPSVLLHALPTGATSQSPDLYGKKYTMVQNQVILVDPETMRVIDILRQ
jgi:Protein of unknown function (DUF1236)